MEFVTHLSERCALKTWQQDGRLHVRFVSLDPKVKQFKIKSQVASMDGTRLDEVILKDREIGSEDFAALRRELLDHLAAIAK
ncbi:MAG: hypothetical protein O3B01_30105 [Planctomycetota bacterium]|nr:hypothetical protein [Planctomycetota bacterium]